MYYGQSQAGFQPGYGQQPMGQTPMLPYPIDRLLVPPQRPTPGQLHFQLTIPCHPNLTQWLPLLGTAAIDAIQAKAQDNALRVFLYNQLSNNNYMNNDFLSFCKSLSQYVEMMMARGAYRDVQSAIFDGAPKIAEMYTAENLRTFPALQQVVDPALIQRCQMTMQLTQQYANELAQYQRQQSMPQQSGYNPYQAGPSYSPPAPSGGFYGPPSTGGGQSPFSYNAGTGPSYHNPDLGPMQSSTYMTRSAKMDSSAQPMQPTPAPVKQEMEARIIGDIPGFATLITGTPHPVSSASVPMSPPPSAWTPGEGQLVPASETTWVPSAKYPFNVAYDYTQYALYYLIEADGAMKPILKPLTPEERMDREKHFKSLNPLTQAHSAERTQALMDELQTQGLAGTPSLKARAEGEGIIVETQTDIHKTAIADPEIWIQAETELLCRKARGSKANAQLMLAYVADPLISEHDPKPLAEKLLEADSFIQACSYLKDAQAAIALSPKAKNDAQILNFLNDRLTRQLNKFVQKNLALDIPVDSFMEDAVSLLEYIEQHKGETFSNPLRLAQTEILRDAAYFFTGTTHNNLHEFYISELMHDLDPQPCVTFFTSADVFVSVNLFYADLKLQLEPGTISTAVFEEHHPLLYTLAARMHRLEAETGEHFNRHLIRTLDRKVLEVHRSKLDPNTYLVSAL